MIAVSARQPWSPGDGVTRTGLCILKLGDHLTDRDVTTKCFDFVVSHVVKHRVRDPQRNSGRRNTGELAGMGTDEVELQPSHAVADDNRLNLRVGIEQLRVKRDDKISNRVPALDTVTGLDR